MQVKLKSVIVITLHYREANLSFILKIFYCSIFSIFLLSVFVASSIAPVVAREAKVEQISEKNFNIPDRNIPLILNMDNDDSRGGKLTASAGGNIVLTTEEKALNARNERYRKEITSKRNRLNFKKYWERAHNNDPVAQLSIGKMLLRGSGVAANPEEGQKWIEKAGKNGNLQAQTELAKMYYERKFYKNSIYWYEQSSGLNSGESLFMLGEIYYKGQGVEEDVTKAVEYYIKSADAGSSKSQRNLFYRYSMGDGVVQDPIEAYKWGMIAVQNRMKIIKKGVYDYGATLTVEQKKEALNRISKWRKSRKRR